METILREILYEVKENSKRLDVLEKDMAELKRDVKDLQVRVARIEEDVNGPRGRLARIEIDVKANRQMLTGMEQRLAERIDGIQNKTALNTQEVRQLKKRLDSKDKIDEKWANETLKYIEVG